MSCRDISPEVLRSARTLEDVYTALGVLRPTGGPTGVPVAPPRTFLPEGMQMTSFPYLTGTDGRSFNLGPLFANNREEYTCALNTLGYNATRGQELDTQSSTMNDEEFQTFVTGLSPSDALTFNIYRTLKVMEYMRTDPPNGDKALGGNTDGNRDVISADEVENWAWERTGHNEEQYRQFGGDAIGRLHALLGIATYLATPPPPTPRPDMSLTQGDPLNLAAPANGWRAGDAIFVDNVALAGVTLPTSGTAAFTIPAASLPVGTHTIEIRRTTGDIERTALTVNTPPPPPAPPPNPSFWDRVSSVWHSVPGEGRGAILLATAAAAVYGVYRAGRKLFSADPTPTPRPTGGNGGGNSGSSDGRAEARVDVRVVADPAAGGNPPTGGSTRVVTDTAATPPPPAGGATRVVSIAPAAAAPLPQPQATRTVVAADQDVADLAAALRSAGDQKSPTPVGGSPSGAPGNGITADNVIIRGADARPSAEINRSVVMAEIAYLNPRFLTEDGTAIHSNYRAGVEQLADLAMAQFGNRPAGEPTPGELWRIEHGERGTMIRGGLPEAWLRDFVTGQLERWHAAGAPGMSFDAVAREAMERDATRRAGERSAYERWVEDALRDPVRLAGR